MLAQLFGGSWSLHVYYGQLSAVLFLRLGVFEQQVLVYAVLGAHLAKCYNDASTQTPQLLSRCRSQVLFDQAAHVVDLSRSSLEGQTVIPLQSLLFDRGARHDDFGGRWSIGDAGILSEILAHVQLLLTQYTRYGAQTYIY